MGCMLVQGSGVLCEACAHHAPLLDLTARVPAACVRAPAPPRRRDGYSKRFGIVYVDRRKDLSRHPKMSAHWLQKYFFNKSTN